MTKPTKQTPWPKHPDGRPLRMGEMPMELQKKLFIEAIDRCKPEFKALGMTLQTKNDLN